MDQGQTSTGAPPTGLQRLQALVHGTVRPSGLFALLGLQPVLAEPGRVVIAAAPSSEHYNSGGSVHGGFTATLLDTAMGCAAQSVLPPGQGVTTMELKIAYHRRITAENGRIEAIGTVLSQGRRAIFTEVRLSDGAGRLLASGSSTLLVVDTSP